jgi:2,3-bisphosphoglycerate-dependent phosphoglycerate mutase
MGKLIIARHHESEWNKQGRWTGSTDVGLSDYGHEMSMKMGELIKDLRIDLAITSAQIRSIETLLCMENNICIDLPITRSAALNERDYGIYTGKNKWDMEKELGHEAFEKLRRTWDHPIPGGETLKQVSERVVPYYVHEILPLLRQGKTVLVVAHGNSLRTLIKYLEKVSDEDMVKVEMHFGEVLIYTIDEEGFSKGKVVRSIPSHVNA